MDEVTVNGVRLAYRVAGDPTAPPLVLLHALGENSGSWDTVVPTLGTRYRTYALDLRGHGASERPGEYSIGLMRDDVLAFLDALGLDRVALLGHSLGGVVAYLVAAAQPHRVTSLALEDPPAPLPAHRAVPDRPDEPIDFDWAVVAGVFRERNDPPAAWWDALTRITAPTLVIAGGPTSHLPQHELAAMAERIPRGRLVTVDAGHEIHLTQPAEFLAAYTNWATSHRGDAAQPASDQ
jgi:pimeloyl-ACP methyl ester carboxylesterase